MSVASRRLDSVHPDRGAAAARRSGTARQDPPDKPRVACWIPENAESAASREEAARRPGLSRAVGASVLRRNGPVRQGRTRDGKTPGKLPELWFGRDLLSRKCAMAYVPASVPFAAGVRRPS